MVSSIVVQCLRCTTGWVVAEEPHVRSVGIKLGLDMGWEVVSSVHDHPDIRRIQPTWHDQVTEAEVWSIGNRPDPGSDSSIGSSASDLRLGWRGGDGEDKQQAHIRVAENGLRYVYKGIPEGRDFFPSDSRLRPRTRTDPR